MIALFPAAAWAASLDNVEIGGVYGTPLAENPTALWWNPAGLSQAKGTQVFVEAEPTFGSVTFERRDEWNGGTDTYRLAGLLPFAGVSTDFGVEGLGVGAAFLIPYVRGGAAETQPGPGSFAFRHGSIRELQGTIGVGYQPEGVPVALGATASLIRSEWIANLDSELTTSLHDQISAMGQDSGYTDAQIENHDYATTLDFPLLSDTTSSFSAGLRADLDPFKLSFAYVHGNHVDNRGPVHMTFGCPPQEDIIGRFGAQRYGLCYAEIDGNAQVSYTLPARVQGAIGMAPNDDVAVQVMGAYVFWSAYTDFDITVSDVETLNNVCDEESWTGSRDPEDCEPVNAERGALVNQHRLWARENIDTYWAGIDAKVRVADMVIVGGRVLYDHRAVPDVALSPNNVDTDVIAITPNVTVDASEKLRVHLAYGHSFFVARDISDSGFAVTVDPAARNEDRWFYPQMNGRYSGSIDRVSLMVSGRFGLDDEDLVKAPF